MSSVASDWAPVGVDPELPKLPLHLALTQYHVEGQISETETQLSFWLTQWKDERLSQVAAWVGFSEGEEQDEDLDLKPVWELSEQEESKSYLMQFPG